MIPQMVPWVTNPEQFTLRTVTGVPHFGNISDINSNLSFSRKKKTLSGLSLPRLLPTVVAKFMVSLAIFQGKETLL